MQKVNKLINFILTPMIILTKQILKKKRNFEKKSDEIF